MTVRHLLDVGGGVYQARGPIVSVDRSLIRWLIERARHAPRGRARVLLHPNREDSLHEMVIALPRQSCDVPHINFKSGKSFLALHGKFAVVVFSDDGKERRAIRLAQTDGSASGVMTRLNTACWHTIIPLADYVVFLETIIGPFVGNRFAPWAPQDPASEEGQAFSSELRQLARQPVEAAD